MIQEKKQLCKACATGNEKHSHNGDMYTCIKGRIEYLKHLSPENQKKELIIHERLSQDMINFIELLAEERKKTIVEIILEEGLTLLTSD